MKVRYDLMKKDKERYLKEFTLQEDIDSLIELSYLLTQTKGIEEFNNLCEYVYSGVELYSLFVNFCLEKYHSEEYNGCSLEVITSNFNYIFAEFKNKYFIDESKCIDRLLLKDKIDGYYDLILFDEVAEREYLEKIITETKHNIEEYTLEDIEKEIKSKFKVKDIILCDGGINVIDINEV